MAKIEPLRGTSSYTSSPTQSFKAKLMAPGEYLGMIIDIGYTTDQEKTRNILYVALARTEKEDVSPRVIRARFDINKSADSVKYELDRLSSFAKAIGIVDSFDTDDSEFLNMLIKQALFQKITFIVDRISSQQGHSFNVVKSFAAPEKSPPAPQKAFSSSDSDDFQPAAPKSSSKPDYSSQISDDDVPF